MKVWTVWTERGEYEQWSRDLRGIFASEPLAQNHAGQLDSEQRYQTIDVLVEDVLTELPELVARYEQQAHINVDGSENLGLGYRKSGRSSWQVWTHECPEVEGRMGRWSSGKPDLYVEVFGRDPEKVAVEYQRLLAEARRALGLVAR